MNIDAAHAHAKRLKDLLERARSEYKHMGREVPDHLWTKIEEATDEMIEALDDDGPLKERRAR